MKIDRLVSIPIESVHLGMGANLFAHECSFRVWAPNAIAVSVCIWREERMSQVSLAPEPSNSSYWSVDVADVVAGQPYQFSIVNKGGDPTNPGGILTRVDAYARQVESAEDNARGIVVDWQQEWFEFATPKFEDLIIYEAHVGSFAGLNDHLNISTYATFADFETKLEYIRELGFNALQLLLGLWTRLRLKRDEGQIKKDNDGSKQKSRHHSHIYYVNISHRA